MTEKIENQDVELQEDEEISEMKHDPKNAEAQSVASVDKAADAGGTAPKRKMAGGTAADNTKQDPMPKTKAGMIAAMVGTMQKMNKKQINAMAHSMYSSTSPEAFDGEPIAEEEKPTVKVEADFKDDLKALVNEEATLSDEFKQKAEIIFETAINSKVNAEIDRLEEKYNEELAEEIESTKADLVEKVDSYLNYVVEGWMEDNKLAIQNGLRTEIAEDFMNKLKGLFTESYIEVPEGKTDMVEELADTVDDLEQKLNKATDDAISMAEELEEFRRDAVIREASKGLADTQVEKLTKLVDNIDYEDQETFAQKVATVKESYFKSNQVTGTDEIEEDDSPAMEVSGSMDQYLKAIKKTAK
ncbi:MAG: hypothetical protein CL507_00060 [Actinobacteria bacterium]|nr:hypothetical protein [Actinomycetota bacterium]|tara:strand:+ start:4767 stop:5840 length:1074 start_codon:yes stop_codon:yes gene_type:complete